MRIERIQNKFHLGRLTELRVTCATAGKWGKPTDQPHEPILITLNRSRTVKATGLNLLSRNFEVPNIDIRELHYYS